ncbi:MAG: hypothetical protein A2096_13505 [Spirochaetes bacterium GWF1_41_5]|nr:MAG: hypothetical protein A2096_13505 [Spirochaetes bacterium GWF1_41_5]HBE04697.1 spore coat protein [Spirochaetia bacterium]
MKTGIIIQARINSSRLPGKILKTVQGKMLIEYCLERLLLTGFPLILAVPQNSTERLAGLLARYPVSIFTGSEEDVLGRYCRAARAHNLDIVIRATADNPFVSVTCCTGIHKLFTAGQYDLAHYTGMPWGSGVEVITRQALEKAFVESTDAFEHEHITQYHYRHPEKFRLYEPAAPGEYYFPGLRVTVDTDDDFKKFSAVMEKVPKSERGIVEFCEIIKHAG